VLFYNELWTTSGVAFTGHVFDSLSARLRLSWSSSIHHRQALVCVERRARLVFLARKRDHVTPLLQQLHWLKMEQRIEYKLALLIYYCLHTSPVMFSVSQTSTHGDVYVLQRPTPLSFLRPVSLLRCLSTASDRAFPVIAARTWNSLPEFVTSSTSLAAFKQHLKTVPFTSEHTASTLSALHTLRRITRPFNLFLLLGVLAVV